MNLALTRRGLIPDPKIVLSTTFAGLKALTIRLFEQLARWQELRFQRHELQKLSDEMLKDIGLSRADVEREIRRPFWDDPINRP